MAKAKTSTKQRPIILTPLGNDRWRVKVGDCKAIVMEGGEGSAGFGVRLSSPAYDVTLPSLPGERRWRQFESTGITILNIMLVRAEKPAPRVKPAK